MTIYSVAACRMLLWIPQVQSGKMQGYACLFLAEGQGRLNNDCISIIEYNYSYRL